MKAIYEIVIKIPSFAFIMLLGNYGQILGVHYSNYWCQWLVNDSLSSHLPCIMVLVSWPHHSKYTHTHV